MFGSQDGGAWFESRVCGCAAISGMDIPQPLSNSSRGLTLGKRLLVGIAWYLMLNRDYDIVRKSSL
jgi:hypothetical protein